MKSDKTSQSPTSLLPALKQLFEGSETMLALYDDTDTLVYGNPMFHRVTGQTPGSTHVWEAMIRENHRLNRGLLIETEDIEDWLRSARQRRGSVPHRQFEIDTVDGKWILMSETVIPGVGILAVGVDITRSKLTTTVLQSEYQQALVEAETDALTHMGNRRALDRLRRLLTLNGDDRTLSALMIDIDWFKPYNDSLGHLQGDECLRTIADVIRSGFRSEEAYPLRIGGEEFLILMVDADLQSANQVAQRILRNIRARAIPHPATEVGYVTLSIGVASAMVADEASISTLLEKADKALYQSKRTGRDRVTLAP